MRTSAAAAVAISEQQIAIKICRNAFLQMTARDVTPR